MDRSQYTYSPVDELRRVESEARRATAVGDLRRLFDRIAAIRRAYIDDFDLQVRLAEVQEIVVERARALRNEAESGSSVAGQPSRYHDTAEIPPEVERLDPKSWQRATYIGLFFAVILFAAFFYLIQTARRLNMTPAETAGQAPQASQANPVQNASTPVIPKPTLRLYTDLVPGSVSVDGKAPEDLKDGELVLDNLEPGRHSIKVTGHTGEAEFSYNVAEKAAPKVLGLPAASNAMVVLVSSEDGKAHLVSNADQLNVSLDGKSVGQADADGLTLDHLGTTDHDLQVTEGNDRQRFVLTYTPAPALTVYVKSDPNTGTVVVVAGQDGAEVYINNVLYRRETEHGQVRIPNLKVGQYTIRVHKPGFLDPPPSIVHVKKAEETRAEFHLQPVPQVATLQVKGALPGTMIYVDGNLAAAIQASGDANISNVQPGAHTIDLRRDGAPTKQFQRTFGTGDTVLLSGPDVVLNKTTVDNSPSTAPGAGTTPEQAPAPPLPDQPNNAIQIHGEQIRKGGGFVPYHTPRTAGHYTFAAMARKGGFLRHGKLQWYAGFQNGENYVLFSLDGKRASVRQVTNDHTEEVNRVPFSSDTDEWVQVEMTVRPSSISARIRPTEGSWVDLGEVRADGSDFTKDQVGFYIPGGEEIAIANLRFSPR